MGSKKFGRVKPRVRSFWKSPKSPIVLRMFPKSFIFTQQMTCAKHGRLSREGGEDFQSKYVTSQSVSNCVEREIDLISIKHSLNSIMWLYSCERQLIACSSHIFHFKLCICSCKQFIGCFFKYMKLSGGGKENLPILIIVTPQTGRSFLMSKQGNKFRE